MIDTWLFAALCFGFLALCALLRVIPSPGQNDRIVSFSAATTIAAAAAIVLSISSGNMVILDAAIVIVLLLFAAILGYAKFTGGEVP